MTPRPAAAPAAIATNGLALRARPLASTAAACLSAGASAIITTNTNRREVEPLQASAVGPVRAAVPKRGSGHSVATTARDAPDTELGYAAPASWRRGKANSSVTGRRVRQHRSFARWGKARLEKWRAEPRPEPDSGNPTVRDRRGASGNVASWDILHAARAPDFYLDNRMHGSMWRREETRPVGPARAARSRRLSPTLQPRI